MHEYLKEKLNDEQFAAATYVKTSSLILAGAGSGKTRVLTYKIANLVVTHDVLPYNILAVTFTNKAANEMKERLKAIAQDIKKLDEKEQGISIATKTKRLTSFPWIGTFHAICGKLLREDIEELGMGYTKNFVIYDTSETASIIKSLIKEANLEEVYEPKEVKALISKAKNEGYDVDFFTKHVKNSYEEGLAKIYKQYQKALIQANAVDFDDLLLLPYVLFRKKPEILHKRQNIWKYILVDEAQDTNRIQFELLRYISKSQEKMYDQTVQTNNITFIGDDYQSIYGRRGAIMENFLNVKKYRPDIVTFKLQINYRSRPHIVQAGNYLIKFNNKQYEKTIVPHRKGNDSIIVLSHPDDTDEAINVIDLISKLHDAKQKKWSDFAILYRTNAQSGIFERVLIQRGIPYRIYGAFKFFERAEIKDIIAYLKILINPKDDLALQRIINVPPRKIGDATIKKLLAYGTQHAMSLYEVISTASREELDIAKTTAQTLKKFITLLQSWQDMLPSLTPAQLIAQIINDIDYKTYLIKQEGEEAGKEKFENIGQLINMAEKFEMVVNTKSKVHDEAIPLDTQNSPGTAIVQSRTIQHGSVGEIVSGTDLLGNFLQEVTLMTEAGEEDIATVDAIKLMTIHASKGLEFPYVFICGLEEGLFPLAKQALDPETLEEERRLMYVAITRAQDELFLSYAQTRMSWGRISNNTPSRFLDEIPQDLVKKYDFGGGTKRSTGPTLDVGDWVKHTLFGEGEVLEVWNNVCIVRFEDPKYGVRKVETKFLKLL